ncbi:MAG TPA: phosphoribosylamine--glycine ligase [Thermoleophilaceae bacterium]
MKRVLVVGSGGREHALVRALLRSPQSPAVIAAPGNAGIVRDKVACFDVAADDVSGLVALAHEQHCDLVVVGPEVPLVAGLVDACFGAGVKAFGPSAAAAHIEGSKAFAKEIMQAAGVPTAPYVVLHDRKEALEHLSGASYPLVLKADSLAAGKGVVICQTADDARAAIDEFFTQQRFGKTTVVAEDFLDGQELSLLALCDGTRAIPMTPAQDYKRIFDGDQGPNTGGMGSYSPVPGFDAAHAKALAATVHQPVVDELRRRGTPFHGVLYAGLMMSPGGPKVLEFNARFGDPETQAILPRMRSDLLDALERSVTPGGLEGFEFDWKKMWAVTVVLASRGYPESASKGDAITGLKSIDSLETEVLHAGTALQGDELVTAGGRVLNVTGLGETVSDARRRAYAAAEKVKFDGKQMRTDIALRAVEGTERDAA